MRWHLSLGLSVRKDHYKNNTYDNEKCEVCYVGKREAYEIGFAKLTCDLKVWSQVGNQRVV